MGLFSGLSQTKRMSLLAVVMLAILLLATGAAWLIVRMSPSTGPRPDERWYIGRDSAGVEIGWMVSTAGPGGSMGRTGYDVQGSGGDGAVASQWELNEQATAGRYISAAPQILQSGGAAERITKIILQDSKVTISATLGGRRLRTVQAQVGPEYLAEGTLDQRVIEVARMGTRFVGSLVIDDAMSLIEIRLDPLEAESPPAVELVSDAPKDEEAPATQPVGWPRRVGRAHGRQPTYDMIYHVAEDGRIMQIDSLDDNGDVEERFKLSDAAEVEEHFPKAFRARTRALHRLSFD